MGSPARRSVASGCCILLDSLHLRKGCGWQARPMPGVLPLDRDRVANQNGSAYEFGDPALRKPAHARIPPGDNPLPALHQSPRILYRTGIPRTQFTLQCISTFVKSKLFRHSRNYLRHSGLSCMGIRLAEHTRKTPPMRMLAIRSADMRFPGSHHSPAGLPVDRRGNCRSRFTCRAFFWMSLVNVQLTSRYLATSRIFMRRRNPGIRCGGGARTTDLLAMGCGEE